MNGIATLPAGIKGEGIISNFASTSFPSAISTDKLQEILEERAANNGLISAGVGTIGLANSFVPSAGGIALQTAQTEMVRGAVGNAVGNQMPIGYAEKLVREYGKAAIEAERERLIAANIGELGKGAAKKAANEAIGVKVNEAAVKLTGQIAEKTIAEGAEEAGKSSLRSAGRALADKAKNTALSKFGMEAGTSLVTDNADKIIGETTKAGASHTASATVLKAAPVIITGAIALGSTVWQNHQSEMELVKLYADDLHKIGVDIAKANGSDLQELIKSDPAKYDGLNQELNGKSLGKRITEAGVATGGGVAGGALGTYWGTNFGIAASAGLATVTAGAAIPAATAIIPTCAAIGGIIGSMAGGSGTNELYKHVIGQKETAIDAMRQLSQKLNAGEDANVVDVTKIIVGNDPAFNEIVKQSNEQGKDFDRLSAEEQTKIIAAKFPQLYQASNMLAEQINNRELTDLTLLTRFDTGKVIEQGMGYIGKVLAVDQMSKDKIANNIVPFGKSIPADELAPPEHLIAHSNIVPTNRLTTQSISGVEPMKGKDGVTLGGGYAGSVKANANAAEQQPALAAR